MILDGVILQQAGELLYDAELTSNYRKLNRDTYLTNLETFSFAIFYADKIASTGALPRIGTHSPGAIIQESFPDKFIQVEKKDTKNVNDFLNDISFREKIRSDMKPLSKSYYKHTLTWTNWIDREAITSLGSHNSIYERLRPEQYIFAKEPALLIDSELQRGLPDDVVSSLCYYLSSQQIAKGVSDDAIREFVTRHLLTHLSIFWWYEYVAPSSESVPEYRVPSPTRVSIQGCRLAEKKQSNEHSYKMITRYVLYDIFKKIMNSNELEEAIMDYSTAKSFIKIRSMLAELAIESKDSNRKKIITDINKETVHNYDGPREETSFDLSLNLHILGFSAKNISQQGHTRKLLHFLQDSFNKDDYMKNFLGLFKELR